MTENMKHTEGPWLYQEESDAYTHIVRAVSNPGRILASTPQRSDGEAEANARLIAAAPELLDALEAAEGFVDGHSESWYKSGQALLAEMRSAINKAKGVNK